MRWVLALAFCVAAAGASWAEADGSRPEPELRVAIGYALPTFDPEDADNALGRRYWDISPPVTVESAERCDRVELTTRAENLFNGRPGFGTPNDPVSIELEGDGFRFRGRAEGPGTALAGETVRVTADAQCFVRGGALSATAQRDFELPAASCDSGPLRVGEVRGEVVVLDWDYEEHGERVLQAGDLVTLGSDLRIEPGESVEVGAPECNGFRVLLYEGAVVGSYASGGRGEAFQAGRAVAQGDEHAGGIHVARRATIWPLGTRCRGCGAVAPASYEIRSTSDRVTVRVYSGAVLAGGPQGRPTLRVPAGHQASVLCSGGNCEVGHVRLFQPNEPWSTPPEGIADGVPRAVEGASPPLSAFAPPHADLTTERLPAAGGEPEQIVVAWSRERRNSGPTPDGFTDEPEQGFLAWQRVSPTRWQLVYEDRLMCCPAQGIVTGDLTGDGHLDALTRESQGSGGCGFSRVLISSGGRLREEFAYQGCDHSVSIENGAVVVRDGVGPCPFEGGAHCSGGTRTTVRRWNGTRLVITRDTVECRRPDRDPSRFCTP